MSRWSTLSLSALGAGHALLFLGERLLGEGHPWRLAASGLGAAAVLFGLGVRAWAWSRAPRRGEARPLLGVMLGAWGASALGLLLYAATLPDLLTLPPDALTALRVAWPIVWLAGAAPALFMELSWRSMEGAERLEGRRVTASGRAGLVVALAAAWLGALNYVGAAWDVHADLRTVKDLQPSGATLELARAMPRPVQVTLFFPPANEVGERVRPYFQALADASGGQLTLTSADQEADPALAETLAVRRNGAVVLTQGEDLREQITLSTEERQAENYLKKLDQDVHRRLARLTRGERVAYFVSGHGERRRKADKSDPRGLSGLEDLLKQNNIRAKNLSAADGLTSAVPENAALVVLAAPRTPLLDAEVGALQRYVTQGGSLLLLLDPDVERPLNLDPLLAELGVQADLTRLAHETRFVMLTGAAADRNILYSRRVARHPSTANLAGLISENNLIFPVTGSLEKRADVKPPSAGGPDVQITARADAGTFADANRDLKAGPDERQAELGLVAAVELPPHAPDAAPGRAIVTADADIVSDVILANSLANQQWATDSLFWLGHEEGAAGAVAAPEDAKIVHTRDEDRLWFYGTVLGVPLLVLGAGIAVRLARRRNPREDA